MAVIGARKIHPDVAGIRNHHTHKTYLDHGLWNHFNRGKQAVEVVGAFHQHLKLTSAQAVGGNEAVRHLEVVVIGKRIIDIRTHHWGDDLTGCQRGAVMHGDHTNLIIRIFDDHRGEPFSVGYHCTHILDDTLVFAAKRHVIDLLFGDHHKLSQVDGISTLSQNLPLRTALSVVVQKGGYILKIVGRDV